MLHSRALLGSTFLSRMVQIGGGLVAGAALVAGGAAYYKHHEKEKAEKVVFEFKFLIVRDLMLGSGASTTTPSLRTRQALV